MHTARDLEVSNYGILDMYANEYWPVSGEDIQELEFLERLGNAVTVQQAYRRSALAASRGMKQGLGRRDPPPPVEEYCKDCSAGEFISRNSLLAVLRGWSEQWPPSPADLAARLKPCEEHILLTLLAEGNRLTTQRLFDCMPARGFHHGESTIKDYLARLVANGLIDNQRSAEPKGYGLTESGRAAADHLSRLPQTEK